MTLYLIDFSFKSPVRIGAPGRDDQAARESIPADQVFSWLSLGWLRLYGEASYTKEVVEPFLSGEHPWVMSDLFPVSGKELCMPAPTWACKKENKTAIDKKKRTAWVNFESFLEALRDDISPCDKDYLRPVRINLLHNVQIGGDPYYTAVTQIYNSAPTLLGDEHRFLKFTGFVSCSNDAIIVKLATAIEYMKEEGFGGNRSSGLGVLSEADLKTARDTYKNLLTDRHRRFVILSCCFPSDSMLEKISSSEPGTNSYTLTSRGGWIYKEDGTATHIQKLKTALFQTGSSFGVRAEGRLVDVGQKGLPSFRYAVPFVVSG